MLGDSVCWISANEISLESSTELSHVGLAGQLRADNTGT